MTPRLTPEEYRELADEIDQYAEKRGRCPSPYVLGLWIAAAVARRRKKTKEVHRG